MLIICSRIIILLCIILHASFKPRIIHSFVIDGRTVLMQTVVRQLVAFMERKLELGTCLDLLGDVITALEHIVSFLSRVAMYKLFTFLHFQTRLTLHGTSSIRFEKKIFLKTLCIASWIEAECLTPINQNTECKI